MSEAELREKIAEVVREAASCPRLCDWLAPERCACGRSADAILALVLPAIQAARVEALREAEQIARRESEWHERSCGDHASAGDKTGMMHAASRSNAADDIANEIATLIEKETAP